MSISAGLAEQEITSTHSSKCKKMCFNIQKQYLSIDCFLEASPHMSVLMVVRSDVAITVPIGLWMPAVLTVLVSISGLGALLHGVSSLRGGRPLARLDSGHLMDVDLSLWRVLNVDIHQRWVEGHWKARDPEV